MLVLLTFLFCVCVCVCVWDHSEQLLWNFTEGRYLHCSYNCRGTVISGSPAVYIDLITNATKLGVNLTTLKVAGIGGNICSQQTAKDMREKLKIRRIIVSQRQFICKVWQLYGLILYKLSYLTFSKYRHFQIIGSVTEIGNTRSDNSEGDHYC